MIIQLHLVLLALHPHNEGPQLLLLQTFHGLPADMSHCTHHGSTVLYTLHFRFTVSSTAGVQPAKLQPDS